MKDFETFRASLSLCPNGCVVVQFGPAVVHLPPAGFRDFVEAANRMLLAVESAEDDARCDRSRH